MIANQVPVRVSKPMYDAKVSPENMQHFSFSCEESLFADYCKELVQARWIPLDYSNGNINEGSEEHHILTLCRRIIRKINQASEEQEILNIHSRLRLLVAMAIPVMLHLANQYHYRDDKGWLVQSHMEGEINSRLGQQLLRDAWPISL